MDGSTLITIAMVVMMGGEACAQMAARPGHIDEFVALTLFSSEAPAGRMRSSTASPR